MSYRPNGALQEYFKVTADRHSPSGVICAADTVHSHLPHKPVLALIFYTCRYIVFH